MRTAIVADWLPVYAGAEHVIYELHALWPDAPIFTTVAHLSRLGPLQKADIRTSSLQRAYTLTRRHEWLLPWMPRAIERIDLTDFDLIISSSHAIGKGIVPPSSAVHICYCHTPMRYAWEMEEEYLRDFHIAGMLKKIARKELKKIRRWDLSTAKRVDRFIANSNETARRIREIYGREATVIHPPVDKRFFANDGQGNANASDFLAVGRLVPYKRFDLLIDVANAHRFPLTIVGRGSDAARLKKLAGSTVTFRGHVSDEELVRLYRNAKALLLPQLEDAGIVPREAQAAGTPVIAFAEGGALDVIVNGVTGVLFSQQTKESLEEALRAFKGMTFDHAAIQEHARKFSSEGFRDAVLALVEDVRQKASASRTATTTYRSPVILNA